MSTINTLTSISPLDGRYRKNIEELSDIVSEAGLLQRRVLVEIEYLIAVAPLFNFDITPFTQTLRDLYASFSIKDAEAIKKWEIKVYHDVKAVEYWLRRKADKLGIPEARKELIHIALTSEDVNNLAYSLQARDATNILLQNLKDIYSKLEYLAVKEADTTMLARTHVQPATPTTFGKEMRVYQHRLASIIDDITAINLAGKLNGATGTYAAHIIALPNVDWEQFSYDFVTSLGFAFNRVTTQIEPHDSMCKLFDGFSRANAVLVDLCQDMRLYIGFGIVKLEVKAREVGSSTMPHKVNPIDFENGTGNLKLANALFGLFSNELPISWMQRDLCDSTLLRNMGSAFGYSLQAYQKIHMGLRKITPDHEVMREELLQHPEILAEAIQTVLRAEGIPNGYELVKQLTRGHSIGTKEIHEFIGTLPISHEAKNKLEALRPDSYIGLAPKLAKA